MTVRADPADRLNRSEPRPPRANQEDPMSDPATYVYDLSEGSASMKSLLGGKGANVAEMTRIGVPVPDGFTITTAACVEAMRSGGQWPEGLEEAAGRVIDLVEDRRRVAAGAP
jgi:pyruvate, orthophosphate dikinase